MDFLNDVIYIFDYLVQYTKLLFVSHLLPLRKKEPHKRDGGGDRLKHLIVLMQFPVFISLYS